MASHDPYAPPRSQVHAAPTRDYEIIGDQIISVSPLHLPEGLCVKCGEHDENGKHYTKKLWFIQPLVAVSVLISPLIYLILYYVMRQGIDTGFSACSACRKKRATKVIASSAAFVASLGVAIAGGVSGADGVMLIGLLATAITFVVALVFMSIPYVRPKGHAAGRFTLAGFGPNFLDALQREDDRDQMSSW